MYLHFARKVTIKMPNADYDRMIKHLEGFPFRSQRNVSTFIRRLITAELARHEIEADVARSKSDKPPAKGRTRFRATGGGRRSAPPRGAPL